MVFDASYRKIVFVNVLFVLLMGVGLLFLYRSEGVKKVVVPAPETDIYTGEVGTSTPVTVSIPAVGIEGLVVPVGKTKSGNMAVPGKYENVGWYRYGSVPGSVGNAVLAGHLDNGRGSPAVFYNLKEMKIGDKVYVETGGGEKLKFMVKEIRLVDYANPPLEEIFGKVEGEMLNLITCDGTWDPVAKIYDKRLIVFTERVRE